MASVYNFKTVTVVPSAKEFIDIVLSKTQRKTPTVIHKGYHISRIRQFYMRKVKFTQKTMDEKLNHVLVDFPRLDDIHPFYEELMHVLYDRDYYKVALGTVGAVRHMVDNVGRDYVRLLKYGDSLYRCKQLKRAALGRMATACKKLGKALSYLEHVRQHMARLPSIDPTAPTLLITGFPNVGKSSFMNKVTRADVEVQPYAFTTKSLFVGHTDFDYKPWQVIDTPGILDHSLEERNKIELQAITALAHLRACILFFMDLSGQCGYSIAQQLSLFRSIKPLFGDRPIVVVLNKCDVCTLDDLPANERASVESAVAEAGAKVISTSTLTDIGVGDLKNLACNLLLSARVEEKEMGTRFQAIQNRLYCSVPQPRDQLQRGPFFPSTLLEEDALPDDDERKLYRRKTQRDYEWEGGGPGRFEANERIAWDLENPEWTEDIMPDFMDGKNIYDYVDPDIHERLLELEDDEDTRVTRKEADDARKASNVGTLGYHMGDTTKEAVRLIRDRVKVMKMEKAMKTTNQRRTHSQQVAIDRFNKRTGSQTPAVDENNPVPNELRKRGRSLSSVRTHTTQAGSAIERDRSRSTSHVSTKTARTLSNGSDRALSVARGEGFRDVNQKLRAVKLSKVAIRDRNRHGKMGESDNTIPDMMPKHLFSGKVKSNKTRDRR